MFQWAWRNRAKATSPPARTNDQNFPFAVQFAVPKIGFGQVIDAIAQWHRDGGLQQHNGRRQYIEGNEYVRWCFAIDEDAQAFCNYFGGIVLDSRSGR